MDEDAAVAASHATQFARRAGGTLASLMLVAGLALTVAPAANANGYPRCTLAMFTGGSVSVTPLGVATISGDVTVPASTQCDGQLVIAAGTRATLHLGGNLTVYALDEASALNNQGTLTITGSGTLQLAGANSVGIDNSGTLTIAGGTVTTTGGEVGGGDGVSNSSALTIAGGTLTATGTYGRNGVYNEGTVTITDSGDLAAVGSGNLGNVGDGIFNEGTVAVFGGAVTATGGTGDADRNGGHGINNHGTMTVVGGSLTATGGTGDSGRNGGNGIFNVGNATLAMTVVPILRPGTGSADGSPLVNFAKVVMPAAPEAGFGAENAHGTVDANNDTVAPTVLYYFAPPPPAGLRSPTHALRTPLLRTPATNTTVGDLLDVLRGISAHWPKASANFTFTGWHSASDSSGAKYRSGDTTLISSLGTPTFYAHWSTAGQSSQSSQSSPTQTKTTAVTTTSAPTTTPTTTATTKTITPTAAPVFTPTNNVADPYTFTSSATPPAPPLPTTSSANDGSHSQLDLSHSSIQQSGDFSATATGFKPGTVVDFYLWSTPIYLGSAVADIHGVAVLNVALTPAYVGEHHVQVVGTGLQGQPRNLAQAITITEPPVLAETGLGAASLLGSALVLLFLGVGLVRVGRRHTVRQH